MNQRLREDRKEWAFMNQIKQIMPQATALPADLSVWDPDGIKRRSFPLRTRLLMMLDTIL